MRGSIGKSPGKTLNGIQADGVAALLDALIPSSVLERAASTGSHGNRHRKNICTTGGSRLHHTVSRWIFIKGRSCTNMQGKFGHC